MSKPKKPSVMYRLSTELKEMLRHISHCIASVIIGTAQRKLSSLVWAQRNVESLSDRTVYLWKIM